MPLGPLPHNNTITAWLLYTSEDVEHEMELRFTPGTADATIINAATGIGNALRPLMKTTDAFKGLRKRDAGSIVSFPLAWTNVMGTNATAHADGQEANFMSAVGRTTGGRKVRATFFTPYVEPNENFRLLEGVDATADAWLSQLRLSANNIAAIDGLRPIWYTYVNFGVNSYWQRQRRRAS